MKIDITCGYKSRDDHYCPALFDTCTNRLHAYDIYLQTCEYSLHEKYHYTHYYIPLVS